MNNGNMVESVICVVESHIAKTNVANGKRT